MASRKGKTALVLSAGGMFGAYQAGVWKAVSTVFKPDIVVGASVGSLNAWAIAGGASADELVRAWTNAETADVMQWHPRLRPLSVFDSRLLRLSAERWWHRYRPQVDTGIVAVELPALRPRLFRGAEIRAEHLLASASVPIVYPAVRIDGTRYCDGGLLGALPLWAAAEMGAESALVVNVLEAYPSAVLRLAVRSFQFVAGGRKPASQLPVWRVCPTRPLGSVRDAISWDPAKAQRWIAQGELDAASIKHFLRDMF